MDCPDLAWKLLLRHRLPAVLAFLFPDIHAQVDWLEQYYLPDKSLLPATADSRTGEREPDFVALVTLHDGRQACLHVEVQCTRQAGFADRMALYHARLRDRFDMPVFSLAILGDRSPGWRPDTSSDGCGTTFRFRIAKLLDFRERQPPCEPVRLALHAHLLALSTRRRPDLRQSAKLRILAALHENRGDVGELNELQKILDWMLPLPAEWQRRMAMDIDEFILEHEKEDKNSLNYLLPELFLRRCKQIAEAEGKAEGKAEGMAEGTILGRLNGQRETLKLQLAVQFGELSARQARALQRADARQLERLAIALLDAGTLDGALRSAGLRI